MFFTQELLERRDSGFGLLWLAATLGAKSSFKKLPKRSVQTADISQLCDLISNPAEPLALRLSSNLMIGVARVYKVKQEIFYTDVTTCFNLLKKAVAEIHSLGNAELQMGQPSLRPDALTLVADPGAAFAMDFDNIFESWENNAKDVDEDEMDDEFDPGRKKPRQQKPKPKAPSVTEKARANLHTLDEDHEYLLSGSFDASFDVNGLGGFSASSDNFGGGFVFDDDFLAIDGAGEVADLAQELDLGDAWGSASNRPQNEAQENADMFAFGEDLDGHGERFDFGNVMGDSTNLQPVFDDRESLPPSGDGDIQMPDANIDTQGQGEALHGNVAKGNSGSKSHKRVRLRVDARIELTDEELKNARANYMEMQDNIRRDMLQKKLEKESCRLIDEMIYGVPLGVQAPPLVEFWLENLKLQVQACSGFVNPNDFCETPAKKRRVGEHSLEKNADDRGNPALGMYNEPGIGMDFNVGEEYYPEIGNLEDTNVDYESRLRSSEKPEQARRASHPPSLLGSMFDLEQPFTQDRLSGSQRSALYPWDNAGVSSSVNGAAFEIHGSDGHHASFGHADLRIRSSSLGSRRESSLLPGGIPASPADLGMRHSHMSGDGFEFEVPGEDSAMVDHSEANLVALERNSANFLEYAKMQLQTFPSFTSTLTFDDVVPKMTSTPRVAAAAFYHCLVLATKDLVGVSQKTSYGTLQITVK